MDLNNILISFEKIYPYIFNTIFFYSSYYNNHNWAYSIADNRISFASLEFLLQTYSCTLKRILDEIPDDATESILKTSIKNIYKIIENRLHQIKFFLGQSLFLEKKRFIPDRIGNICYNPWYIEDKVYRNEILYQNNDLDEDIKKLNIEDVLKQTLIPIFDKNGFHQDALNAYLRESPECKNLSKLIEYFLSDFQKAKDNSLKLSFFHKDEQKSYDIDPKTVIEQLEQLQQQNLQLQQQQKEQQQESLLPEKSQQLPEQKVKKPLLLISHMRF